MMNVTGLGVNPTENSQLAFKAKTGNRKAIHEFIDKSNDLAMDILNKNRPIAEQREIAIRKSLSALKIKYPYIGGMVEKSKAAIEHIRTLFK